MKTIDTHRWLCPCGDCCVARRRQREEFQRDLERARRRFDAPVPLFCDPWLHPDAVGEIVAKHFLRDLHDCEGGGAEDEMKEHP